MRLGTVTYNLAKDWNLDQLLDMCRKTGFEGVELRTTHAHGVEPSLTAEERATVKGKFQQNGVVLCGLGTVCEYHSADPEVVRQNIKLTEDFIKLAKDVGAIGVKVRPNGFAEDKGISKEQTLEQIGNALLDCAKIAEPYGIELWLEVHGPGTSHPPYIQRIMEVADHPLVGVCWNCNQADIKDDSIQEYLTPLVHRVRECHIHDLYEDYPYFELISMLQEVDFDGFCLTEMPESCEPERLMKYYRLLWSEWTE
ncbi:sugar phosphate isomerase/epimerase [bacterium]|nr:sugar phosphate isomerase/epimerase [bacterium]